MTKYFRLMHMKDVPLVKKGEHVRRGQVIGYVGNTGHSTGCHMHADLFKVKPSSPYLYTIGMTREQVLSIWEDPKKYFVDNLPVPNTLPLNGYQFMQKVMYKRGKYYYHNTYDQNSPNDCGVPVKSPVDGKVWWVAPKSSWYNRKNHGFGNMLIIEFEEVEASQKRKVIKIDKKLTKRLEGKLLLQVENKGQLWYVHNGKKYFLGTTEKDYQHFVDLVRRGVIRALGISNDDINKIETGY